MTHHVWHRVFCGLRLCGVLVLVFNLCMATHLPVAADDAPLISEGVHLIGADQWQAAGFTGKGVKIGMLDFGITGYKEFLGGAKITARSFRADGMIDVPNIWYTTAYLEVLHEVAPDAEIVFAAIDTTAKSYDDALNWLVRIQGVSVLADNITFDISGPLDGTSMRDQQLDEAKAAGVFTVVPLYHFGSGYIGSNTDSGHYGATFTDTDGDLYHDFSPPSGIKGTNALPIRVLSSKSSASPNEDQQILIKLTWDDWREFKTAYYLVLTDKNGKEIARGEALTGSNRAAPYRGINTTLPPGDYFLRVMKGQPEAPNLPFDIFFLRAASAASRAQRFIDRTAGCEKRRYSWRCRLE